MSKCCLLLVLTAMLSFSFSVPVVDDVLALFIRRMKTFFAVADVNKDGIVNGEDYHDIYSRFAKRRKLSKDKEDRMHKDVIDKAWKLLPFDKQGKGNPVTVNEMVESLKGRRLQPKLREGVEGFTKLVFTMVNANDDDAISLDEWTDNFRIFNISDEVAAESFNKMDTNHDKNVSDDEYVVAGLDFFFGTSDDGPGALLLGPRSKSN